MKLALLLSLIIGAETLTPKQVEEYLMKTAAQVKYSPKVPPILGALQKPLEPGEVGRIDSFKVLQVVDSNNLRADITWSHPVTYPPRVHPTTGLPIEKERYGLSNVTEDNIWIADFPTGGLVDGKSYECNPLTSVFIVGTKSYINALGSRATVVQLTPVDIKPQLRTFVDAADTREAKAKREAAEKVAAATKAAEDKLFRTWRDASGKFSVDAKFIGFGDNKVTLEKRDGSLIRVLSRKLSKEDQEFFRTELKKRRNK